MKTKLKSVCMPESGGGKKIDTIHEVNNLESMKSGFEE